MKKIIITALFFITTTAFGEQFVLDNQTSYPEKNQKIAIQWTSSAQEVDANNKALMYDPTFKPTSLKVLNEKRKIEITIPKNALYFRILAWSKGGDAPDFSTNWIEVIPGKDYTLKTDHLVPVVLMSGMGC